MTTRVGIVIVNWNSGTQISDCVDSIAKYRGDVDVSVVVIDNGSQDGSDELVEGIPGVKLVRAGANLGFAKACNLGAAQVGSAEYLLFLNPDAAVLEGTLAGVVKFMNQPSSKSVGVCGVALVDQNRHVWRSCARFPTPMRLACASIGLDRVKPSFGTFMTEWDHAESRIVEQVIGAFFFVRREVFQRLSGFDERFFVYFEEVDFAMRAAHVGARTMYLASVQAFHAGGGTSNQVRARRLFYSLRSRLLFSSKHFSLPGQIAVMSATLLLEPLTRIGYCIVRGQLGGVSETISAYGMLLHWLVAVRTR